MNCHYNLQPLACLISLEEKCDADQAGKVVVTSLVSAEASATEETEDSRLRDMEACDWSIVLIEASNWLIATEVLRLRFGRVEFRPEIGGELPRVKLGREGEPGNTPEMKYNFTHLK